MGETMKRSLVDYLVCPETGAPLTLEVAEEDVDQDERKVVLSSKVGVDATRKHRFPARSVPPKEDLDRVDAHWADYGLE